MNAEPMQRAWAREHGIRNLGLDWMLQVLYRQVRQARPEVLFIQSFRGLTRDFVRALRASCASIKLVVGWCGSSTDQPPAFEVLDAVLSCVPELVKALNADGHRCIHMHHAFDPRVLDRIDRQARKSVRVSFVGNLADQQQHRERVALLRSIASRTELQVYASMPADSLVRWCRTAGGRIVYAGFQALVSAGVDRSMLQGLPYLGRAAVWGGKPLFVRRPVPKGRLHPAVYGLRMFQVLHNSEVTLNVHSSHSPRSASNLRLFEATGVGTCLLTDWKDSLHELFDVDREVVAYRSSEECVEKLAWLASHPAERQAIVDAGQRRVLGEHTFAHRADVFDNVVKGLLAGSPASRA